MHRSRALALVEEGVSVYALVNIREGRDAEPLRIAYDDAVALLDEADDNEPLHAWLDAVDGSLYLGQDIGE